MKMAKKVLSVVLAVVMALSCFAVAGSAFGPAEATKNSKIILKAAVGSSKCYVDPETVEDVVEFVDPEADKAAEVNAKVGDTVYIYVYGDTDYYVHSFFAEVFYPSIFKTPSDVYNDSLIAIDPEYDRLQELSVDVKKAIFFGNSPLIQNYTLAPNCFFSNEWFVLPDATKNNVKDSWPTDEDGNIIEGFGSGTTPSTDWNFIRFGLIVPDASKTPTKLSAGDTYTYRLPLYIPEGTPDGTYTVTVPEAAAAQKIKPTGITKIGEVATTYNKLKKIDTINSPVKTVFEYDKEGTLQNFDFSQATVTITVQSDTPTPPTPLTWDALQSAYDDAILLDEEDYTTSSWDESGIETAIANAAAELNETTGHKCETQEAIKALEDALTNAMDALDERVDTANLEAALSDSAVINKDDYVEDAKWTAFENAVKAGTELMEDAADTSADDQEIFDNAAQAIFDAITALTPALADYTEYDKAVAAANTAFTKTDWYSEGSLETLSGVMDTYGSLSRDYLKKDQDTVDAAKDAINYAVANLALLPATDAYEALKASIDAYDKLTETDYTPASWRDFAAALAEAKQFYETTPWVTQKAEDEAKYSEFIGIVEAVKVDLDEAKSDLVEAGDANYDALDGIIGDFYELNEDAYTSDSWGDVENYIDNEIDYTLNENFQDTIDKTYIPALNALIDNLVFEEFDITYDYYVGQTAMAEELADNVENSNKTTYTYEDKVVIDKANISLDGYTCESVDNTGWDAETTTGDKTVKVTFSKNEAAQHSITYNYVDEAGDPVSATTSKPATFKEDESITFTAADFTAVSSNYEFKSVNPTTIAEGTTTDVTVTVTFKLKDADYSALDDAIKAAEAKKQYQYTEESWTPFAEALADAKKVDRTLKITDQGTVDAAKDLLNAKMDALVIAVNGSVYDVDYTPVKGQLSNTFEIKVDGRAMMIQFQELSHGEGTRSYDRYNKEHVSIVSYDKDGNVVGDYSKDIAYEIWTVTTRIDGPEIGIRVKNNGSSKWETPDKAYKFTYEKVEVKADIISAELTATSGPQGGVAATVVAGPDAERVMFKMEDGSTATMYAKNATPDKDGNLVFTGKAFMNHAGLNTITIRVLADNKWTTSETTLTYTADAAKK